MYIDESQTSSVLAKAFENATSIIVTTLQRFPVISESVADNKDKTYGVIIEEAHSSKAGESARHLRKALSLDEAENADGQEKSLDEIIADEIKGKGDQKKYFLLCLHRYTKAKQSNYLAPFEMIIKSF